MFGEPPRSEYDLNFSLFGFPVRIHPLFWLISAMLGLSSGSMRGVLLWIVAVFIAILVHELGHALVQRRYGLHPWIVLYGMGGLACTDSREWAYSKANTWIRQILISFAGPGAGFLLAFLLIGIVVSQGHSFTFFIGAGSGFVIDVSSAEGVRSMWLSGTKIYGIEFFFGENFPEVAWQSLINSLVWISLIWGIFNLLPIYPLDGGKIAREILLRFRPAEGIRYSLVLSMLTAGGVALFSLVNMLRHARAHGSGSGASLFVPLLFGYLAYMSYATLQAYNNQRPRW
jgi:membrane-associated protease RseP (regulator of RpoE activity)